MSLLRPKPSARSGAHASDAVPVTVLGAGRKSGFNQLICAFCVLFCAAQMALAVPHSPSERAKLFATCSGFLGALAVQQRAIDPQEARKTEQLQHIFDDLLDAVLPDAIEYGMPAAVAHNWRFTAWVDNSEILNEVSFSFDAGRAARAQQLADRRYAACRDLILPS